MKAVECLYTGTYPHGALGWSFSLFRQVTGEIRKTYTADVGMEKLKISDTGSVQGYRALTQALDSAS